MARTYVAPPSEGIQSERQRLRYFLEVRRAYIKLREPRRITVRLKAELVQMGIIPWLDSMYPKVQRALPLLRPWNGARQQRGVFIPDLTVGPRQRKRKRKGKRKRRPIHFVSGGLPSLGKRR
jgi:hypothetical protein